MTSAVYYDPDDFDNNPFAEASVVSPDLYQSQETNKQSEQKNESKTVDNEFGVQSPPLTKIEVNENNNQQSTNVLSPSTGGESTFNEFPTENDLKKYLPERLHKEDFQMIIKIQEIEANGNNTLKNPIFKFNVKVNKLPGFRKEIYKNIRRTYKELESIYKYLIYNNIEVFVPALPAVSSLYTPMSPDFVVSITNEFQDWFNRICCNPILIKNKEFSLFFEQNDFSYVPSKTKPSTNSVIATGLKRKTLKQFNPPYDGCEFLARYRPMIKEMHLNSQKIVEKLDRCLRYQRQSSFYTNEFIVYLSSLGNLETSPEMVRVWKKFNKFASMFNEAELIRNVSLTSELLKFFKQLSDDTFNIKESLTNRHLLMRELSTAEEATKKKHMTITKLKMKSTIDPIKVDEAIRALELSNNYEKELKYQVRRTTYEMLIEAKEYITYLGMSSKRLFKILAKQQILQERKKLNLLINNRLISQHDSLSRLGREDLPDDFNTQTKSSSIQSQDSWNSRRKKSYADNDTAAISQEEDIRNEIANVDAKKRSKMFKKTSTPDLSLHLSSPFGKKRLESKNNPNASNINTPTLSNSMYNDDTSIISPISETSQVNSKLSLKNPLKTIKKLAVKSEDDEIDTRDYYSASPNLNFGNSFDSNSNPNSRKSTMGNLKSPSLSLPKFRTTENLSSGLEEMPYGIYELQKYGIIGNVQTMAFDPIQSLMAVITQFNHIYIFGQARVNVTFTLNSVSPIRALRFIKGIYLIAVDSANSIFVISLLQKKVIHTCIAKIPITAFACDYSLEFVYIGLKNGSVRAFNIETGMDTILNLREQQTPVFRLQGASEVSSLSIHPRDIGTLLISYPKVTVIYNLVDNSILYNLVYKLPKTAPGGENSLYEYSTDGIYYPKVVHNLWHPNGLHCITVHADNSIVFWDAKTGEKILARTLFDVDVDEPTGKNQRIGKHRMTRIEKIKWLCEENPEKTSLLILGGDGYSADGYHQLVRMDFGKMISYSLTSYAQMAKYYSQPREQRIFAIHSKANIVDFVPLGESSPYFDGCHDAKLIAVVMSDGALKFLHYPEGNMSMNAKYFPSTVSWLNPKITCSTSSYLDRRIINSLIPIRKVNEPLDSILKGGIPCRPKYKADAGSLIITGHENGFVRLWDASEGELDSTRVFEIDIAATIRKDDESASVINVSFAPETLEVACSLANGDVLLFAYQMNKNYKSTNLITNMASLSLENSGRALINIQDRAPTNIKKGFMPKMLIKSLDNGLVTAVTTSNLGFVAIGYESGRLLLIDRRSGAVIHNELLKDKGLNIPVEATCIEFSYGLHSASPDRGTLLMYVGTKIGRLLTFQINGLPGSFRVSFVEQIDCNDEGIESIISVNSENGRPIIPTMEHVKRDISSDRVYPYVIASSRSDIRVIKNNSKFAHKTYNRGDISKVGITGAKTTVTSKVAFCLVVILGGSKQIISLSIPSLMEMASLRIPYRIEPRYAIESSVLPLGDVFIRITETEAALVNIMKIRSPIMSIETIKSQDTLFLKNIAVPWRPGANPVLKNTPSVSYDQLYRLLIGRDRVLNPKSDEEMLSWEVSCYNPANYTYISTYKPIYYNPNALHQNTQLMETPKRDMTKKRIVSKSKEASGWFGGITNYAASSLETAQNNVDAYLGDLNDDFDKMISDAKNDAIKGVIGTALFFINGIAVLSEDRFLARIGWSSKNSSTTSSNIQSQYGYGDFNNGNNSLGSGGEGIKARLVNLISATRTLLRIPLIIVNILVIIYELVLG
ncbi:hypothetical protein C6P40_002850 [Pichia californica]|uniref:PX domain-containing protein n=1 Tax=Pichia californica TaxID=460514 RepID=A0A9P6WJ89_9ASCO|nr:hypothetical protein C6P40_002850 [[Candida] californica]